MFIVAFFHVIFQKICRQHAVQYMLDNRLLSSIHRHILLISIELLTFQVNYLGCHVWYFVCRSIFLLSIPMTLPASPTWKEKTSASIESHPSIWRSKLVYRL